MVKVSRNIACALAEGADSKIFKLEMNAELNVVSRFLTLPPETVAHAKVAWQGGTLNLLGVMPLKSPTMADQLVKFMRMEISQWAEARGGKVTVPFDTTPLRVLALCTEAVQTSPSQWRKRKQMADA